MITIKYIRFRKGNMDALRNKPEGKLEYNLDSKYQPGQHQDPWTYKERYSLRGKRQLDKEIQNLRKDIQYYNRKNFQNRFEKFKFHVKFIRDQGRLIPKKNDYINIKKSESFGIKIYRNNLQIAKILDELEVLRNAKKIY